MTIQGTALMPGTRMLSVHYSGDDTFAASSTRLRLRVSKAQAGR